MHGPSGQGEGGRTGELCFNHSLIHTNLSWNKSLSLTKKRNSLSKNSFSLSNNYTPTKEGVCADSGKAVHT